MDKKQQILNACESLLDPVDTKKIKQLVEDNPKAVGSLHRLITSAMSKAEDNQIQMAETISDDIKKIKGVIERGGWNYTTVIGDDGKIRFCYTTGLISLVNTEIRVDVNPDLPEDVLQQRVDAAVHLVANKRGLHLTDEELNDVKEAAGDIEVIDVSVQELIDNECYHIGTVYTDINHSELVGHVITLK